MRQDRQLVITQTALRSLILFLAFSCSALVAYQLLSPGEYIILTVFFVGNVITSAALRQGLSMMLLLLCATLLVSFLLTMHLQLLAIILFSVLIIYSFFSYQQMQNIVQLYFLQFAIFSLILILTAQAHSMHQSMIEILIGTMIAITFFWISFNVQIVSLFRKQMLPILRALIQYAQIQETVGSTPPALNKAKEEIEDILISAERYPSWVYAVGFNPGLRGGFRLFLINLERLIEMYFVISSLLADKKYAELPEELRVATQSVLQQNNKLLSILYNYFSSKKFLAIDDALNQDVKLLEERIRTFVPEQMELLDIAPQYIFATELVRMLKDMRITLLELTGALTSD